MKKDFEAEANGINAIFVFLMNIASCKKF